MTNRLGEALRRLRAFVLSGRADSETREEFEFHVEQATLENIAAGMDRDEARREAERSFGNRASLRELTREERGASLAEDFLRDAALGLRQILRQPLFSFTTIATIALGVGSVTAIWSVVDGVLLRPAPVEELDRLVMIWQTDRRSETLREPASWPDFEDIHRRLVGVESVAAFSGAELTWSPGSGDDNQRLAAMAVTGQHLDMLGLAPVRGRGFGAEELVPGGPSVAMLAESFWRDRLDADPAVVGRTVELDGRGYQVVGIAPSAAAFGLDQVHGQAAYHAAYSAGEDVDLWLPVQADESSFPRQTHPFLVIGRLAEGADVDTLQAAASELAAELEEAYPDSNAGRGLYIEPLERVVFGGVRPVLWLLVGAVVVLLTVAFVNVTNLLLARGAGRGREVALRSALGAGVLRIARQLVVEHALLTAVGAALGIGLAYGILHTLLRLAPPELPRVGSVAIDLRVLTLTLAVSALGALVFGLVPTLQAMRVDVTRSIGGGGRSGVAGRRSARLRRLLVVGELALSVTLVICAGLLARSLYNVVGVESGFRVEGILKAEVQLPRSRYPRDFADWPHWDEVSSFNDRLHERLARIPGAVSVALAATHPLDRGFTNSFAIVGREDEAGDWPEISVRTVSPTYFETLGVDLLEGRLLQRRDVADQPAVAVINRTAARRLFEGRAAVGEEIRFWGVERRIVGVVEDERIHGLTEAAPMAIYSSLAQAPSGSTVALVAVDGGDPSTLADEVRRAVTQIDPGLAVFGLEPLAQTLAGTFAERRFAMRVVLFMAATTLLLALFGVHGVLSYSAATRTREMGIRSALGARRWELSGLMVRSGLGMATAGIALGLVVALATSRFLGSLLFGVGTVDPVTYLGVPALVLVVAFLGSWIPALRVARVEAVEALKAD